ncbi:hypothetical protein HYX06_06560 [Candidatus Woesearchaeota archaeon]|nr:hypothetical protein [Candidatus Woesearchaeota archaeon]
MNLDNRVYLSRGNFLIYVLPYTQPPQNIAQNPAYHATQQPSAVFDISQLVEGMHLAAYSAETPEIIRRPPEYPPQYDLPVPLRRIPRIRGPRRGPGRLPPIPPGGEKDKKKKDPTTIQ